jgi:hypothetical protein
MQMAREEAPELRPFMPGFIAETAPFRKQGRACR